MKKILLSTVLIGTILNAQIVLEDIAKERSLEAPFYEKVEQTIGNKKNFFTNKDHYHKSYNDMKDVKTIYRNTYNDDYSRLLYTEVKVPNGSGGFYVQFKNIKHYDEKGRVYIDEQLEDKRGNGELEKDKMTYFEFNDNGSLKMKTQELWDEDLGRYAVNRRYLYFYENNRLSYIKWQAGDAYRDLFTDSYIYDDKGRVIEVLRKYVDNEEGGAYIWRELNTYDDKGRQIGYLLEYFKTTDGTWDPHYKNEVNYDDNGNVIDKVSYNNNGVEWKPAFRTVPEYNMEELYSDTYGGRELPSKNIIVAYNFYEYDRHYDKWVHLTHNELFYDYNVLSTKNIKENADKVEIYPNPTADYFSIKTQANKARVEIYNTLGQRVKQFKNLQDKYNVNDLDKGTYIVIVKTNDKQYNLKLIKN